MKSMILALVLVVASGCEIQQPFAGPGFKDGKVTSAAAGPFIASTTILLVKDDSVSTDTFNKHMTILQEKLKTQPGLIGLSLAFTPLSNKDWRTLAVWESEDAMFAWVASDEHAAAMSDMADKAESGSQVASWEIKKEEVPPTWDDAKAHLEKDGQAAY